MTTTELLDIAAAMIAYTDTSVPRRYGLFVTDKQLHCQPLSARKPNDLLIAVYSRRTVEEGGASDFWDRLETRLRKLQKEGLL